VEKKCGGRSEWGATVRKETLKKKKKKHAYACCTALNNSNKTAGKQHFRTPICVYRRIAAVTKKKGRERCA
jgi:hypothetical protein